MKEKKLIGVTEFEDQEGNKVQLEYYLLAEPRDTVEKISIYGIEIKKMTKIDNRIQKEKETARALSYSRGSVEQLIKVLLRNQITPMVMLEVIDDYITKEGLSA